MWHRRARLILAGDTIAGGHARLVGFTIFYRLTDQFDPQIGYGPGVKIATVAKIKGGFFPTRGNLDEFGSNDIPCVARERNTTLHLWIAWIVCYIELKIAHVAHEA